LIPTSASYNSTMQFLLSSDWPSPFLDFLFYHLRLRCYIVIYLKMKSFDREFAGKMNFCLSAVERDHLTVEYTLRDLNKPIGVA
jgi:hypothetical protein